MAVSRWVLNHKASVKDVVKVMKTLELVQGADANTFVKKISEGSFWREVKVRVRSKEVAVYVFKAEDAVTEHYFDYLLKAGYFLGTLAHLLSELPLFEGVEETEEDDDDEEEDDLDLDGDDDGG